MDRCEVFEKCTGCSSVFGLFIFIKSDIDICIVWDWYICLSHCLFHTFLMRHSIFFFKTIRRSLFVFQYSYFWLRFSILFCKKLSSNTLNSTSCSGIDLLLLMMMVFCTAIHILIRLANPFLHVSYMPVLKQIPQYPYCMYFFLTVVPHTWIVNRQHSQHTIEVILLNISSNTVGLMNATNGLATKL